jgi:hypothetical protein
MVDTTKPPSDNNPEVEVAGHGVTMTMWRTPECTVGAAVILAEVEWSLSFGAWRAQVLKFDSDTGRWVRRDKPVSEGWQSGRRAGDCYLCMTVDKRTWCTPEQFEVLVAQFVAGIQALYAVTDQS